MSNLDVCQELGQNFIDYAHAVNSDRAIPSAADGLKPVARRILWGMDQAKVFSNKAHVKCATVVGKVMGDYHPHGDSSIYDAMTRLAQEWSMRYPLIDWHGNKGGITGDGAAAYRYTECRLEKLAESGFLANLNKNVVDMQPNYSEVLDEPVLLPAVFPNLLCNPTEGIGLAMACKWLPHNLNDVAGIIKNYVENENLDYSNLYPDFPTGGTIINKDEVHKIYETGKGKVVIEGKYKEEKRGTKNLLVFYEIPFQVYLEPLLEQINKAYEAEKVQDILAIRDESGKKGTRIVIELAKDANVEKVLAQLFAETDLRKSYSANQVALIGKTPRQLNLKQVLDIYVKHNLSCIVREHEYEFNKANTRIEILEGLSKALEDIENIIALIKGSASAAVAKSKLMEQYKFTEAQAKAILDMKLARLANLEKVEVNNELEEKRAYALQCREIMESQDRQKSILIQRLQELVTKFGDSRRTDITQKTVLKVAKPKDVRVALPEDVVVTLNKDGYLQSIPLKAYKNTKAGIVNSFKTQTTDMILLFTNRGKVYRIAAGDIAQCGIRDKGVAAGSIIKMESGEKVLNIFSMNIDEARPYITGFTKGGLVKKSDKTIYIGSTRNLNGLKAAGLNDDDEFISIYESNGDFGVVGTNAGMIIRFELDAVNPVGKTAKGVKSIALRDGDFVSSAAVVSKKATSVKVNGKVTEISKIVVQGRAGKGRKFADAPIIIGD